MSQIFDLEASKRLLNEIADLCEHASLTGSLASGNRRVAERYNSVLLNLERLEILPTGIFVALDPSATFDDIGVEARMLAAYCNKDKRRKHERHEESGTSLLLRLAPFVRQEELGQLIREQRQVGATMDLDTIANLAPFLGQDILSDLLREQLVNQSAPKSPEAPMPPSEPKSPETRTSFGIQRQETSSLLPVAPTDESLDDLLNLLKSQYLSDEEREALVERVRNFQR